MTNIFPSYLDEKEDNTIRPFNLDEFIGQKPLIEMIKILIQSSIKRGEPIDHILFAGPPGLGKTSLANIIAHEMRADIKTTSGPSLDTIGLIRILTSLKTGDIFFIDEIHRLSPILREMMYPVMEDFYLESVMDEPKRIEHFTLIGATTKLGLLDPPFRARFGFVAIFNLYQLDELVDIVYRASSILGCPVTQYGAEEIAKRSRGTPRTATRLFRRVRDYAIVKNAPEVNEQIADVALSTFGIDKLGLDDTDRRILRVIAEDFGGGPVGVKTIANSIGEEIRTVEDVYEPFLISMGLIRRTPQGREITNKGIEHLGIKQKSEITLTNIEKIEYSKSDIISKQGRYKNYAEAIGPIISNIRDNIEKSDDHKVRINVKELAKNMGSKFEKITEKSFIWGLRYTLFHNNLFLENVEKIEGQNVLVIRERMNEDSVPSSLQ